jgi:hypothetical protein
MRGAATPRHQYMRQRYLPAWSNLRARRALVTMTASIFDDDFDLIALYASHFFRAPDASGLAYWAARLDDGMPLQVVARTFSALPESVAVYPQTPSTTEFVRLHYGNALNRDPDAPGMAYWVNDLETGVQSRDTFMLAFIHGALAPTGSPRDAQYLANKAEAGDYFAWTLGLDSTDWGGKVMALVTPDPASVDEAQAMADYFAGLPQPVDLLPMVGVAEAG